MGCTGSKAGDASNPGAQSKSNVPVVVVSRRLVPEDKFDEFQEAYLAAGNWYMTNIPGVKAVFMSKDAENPNVVHDIQWFNDMTAFKAHVDMTNEELKPIFMNWVMKYDMSEPFSGDVFGGWDDFVISETKGKGAAFEFRKPEAGFIKQKAGGADGPPVILSTKRSVIKGHEKDHIAAFQKLADFEYKNFPGVIAKSCAYDEKDPQQTHNFAAFANQGAFEAWCEEASKEEKTPFKELLTAMLAHYDQEKPYTGEMWCADQAKVEPKITEAKGQYVYYDINSIIGQVDLSKGEKNTMA